MTLALARSEFRAAATFLGELQRDLAPVEEGILSLEAQADPGKARELLERVKVLRGRSAFFGPGPLQRACERMEAPLKEALTSGALESEAVDWLLAQLGALGAATRELQAALESQPEGADLDERLRLPTPVMPETEWASKPKDPPAKPAARNLFPPGLLQDFLDEATDHLEHAERLLLELEAGQGQDDHVHELFRQIHSLKGGAALAFSASGGAPGAKLLEQTRDLAHRLETVLQRLRAGQLAVSHEMISLSLRAIDQLGSMVAAIASKQSEPLEGLGMVDELQALLTAAPGTIASPASAPAPAAARAEAHSMRVDKEKLDELMAIMGELLTTRGAFQHLSKRLIEEVGQGGAVTDLRDATQSLGRITRSLQDLVMDLRMQEIRTVFQRFPRVVRDVAQQNGKRIRLEISGEETRLDKTVIELISDPLMHIVRNAADHGIEPEGVRQEASKPPEGTISLNAERRGDLIVLRIEDDGRGMVPDNLRKKAVQTGLLSERDAAAMSDQQALELIFLPGFSTAARVTDLSGRGVGMDVVRTNIQRLNGTIGLESRPGQGTRVTIQLPLTLAVSTGLLLASGGETFVIPVEQVVELVKVPFSHIRPALGGELLSVRGEVLPIKRLDRMLGLVENFEQAAEACVLIVQGQGRRLGLLIDRPLREQEFIIKPLHGSLQRLPGLSGATILGDGRVLLILDADRLAQLAVQTTDRQEDPSEPYIADRA